MNLGEYKRINERCGYALVADMNKESWFVVFAHNFDDPEFSPHDLGRTLGKGKSIQEALENALSWLTDRVYMVSERLEKRAEEIRTLSDISIDDIYHDDSNPKMPINTWEYTEDGFGIKDTDRLVEADIMVFDGVAQIGIA